MQHRSLGNTGIMVSPLTIGAWQLGGPLAFDGEPDGHPDPGRDAVIRMIRKLGDLGINAVDTAEQYSDGESERRVGEAILGKRRDWVVSSKFGYRIGARHTRIDDSSPPTILPSLEGSLKRLQTDYIDAYLYHCRPERKDIDAGREILEQAKQQGKILSYGISTGDAELTQELAEHDAVEVVQFPSSLLDDDHAMWRLAREHSLGTQVRGVMAQGRLSGKYFQHAPSWREDDRRSHEFRTQDFRRYAALADCLPEGWTMAQAAIRWTLDHEGCHTICLGAKNLEDYRAAIAAVDLPPLDQATRERLEGAAGDLGDA